MIRDSNAYPISYRDCWKTTDSNNFLPILGPYSYTGPEYDEDLVCKDLLNMGILPLEWY